MINNNSRREQFPLHNNNNELMSILLLLIKCLQPWRLVNNYKKLTMNHFIFAVLDQPTAVLAWISHTDRASYYNMAIGGYKLYTINYPLRLNRWYHSCQSWNAQTGEWFLFVNGERVGRGFTPEVSNLRIFFPYIFKVLFRKKNVKIKRTETWKIPSKW